MSSNIYIRPVGIFASRNLGDEESYFGGLPLTGDGSLYYSAVEVFERQADGEAQRRVQGLNAIWEADYGAESARIAAILERLSDPRARIAGCDLTTPTIMGIVNVTPDSFSDGGEFFDPERAISHALRLEDEGAHILDIGGESTRPDAQPVSLDDELRRVMPVIEGLAGRVEARLSIDTRKAEIMERAADAGVDIINDVSALTYDPDSLEVAARTGLPVILMHAQGGPQTMQKAPSYGNVLLDVYDYLEARIAACEDAGISRSRLVIDPGIGFGKTVDHNLALLGGISIFHGLGVPLLLGASRKRFIGTIAGEEDARSRLPGSLSAAISAIAQGVQIIRVHDVKETRQAIDLWQAIENEEFSG